MSLLPAAMAVTDPLPLVLGPVVKKPAPQPAAAAPTLVKPGLTRDAAGAPGLRAAGVASVAQGHQDGPRRQPVSAHVDKADVRLRDRSGRSSGLSGRRTTLLRVVRSRHVVHQGLVVALGQRRRRRGSEGLNRLRLVQLQRAAAALPRLLVLPNRCRRADVPEWVERVEGGTVEYVKFGAPVTVQRLADGSGVEVRPVCPMLPGESILSIWRVTSGAPTIVGAPTHIYTHQRGS